MKLTIPGCLLLSADHAEVAELADALGSGPSSLNGSGGSNPPLGTMGAGSPRPSLFAMRLLRLLAPAFLALGVLACTGPSGEKKGNVRDKYDRLPDVAAKYAAAVERRELLPGMHKDEIRVVMRGKPEKITKQKRGKSTYTVWEYRSKSLDLYLDKDGFLIFIRAPV